MSDIIAMHKADLIAAVTAEVKPLKARIATLETELVGEKESAKFYNRRLYQTGEDLHDALTRIRDLEAALRDGIAVVNHLERGSTHWDGCVGHHKSCAWLERVAALSGARTAKAYIEPVVESAPTFTGWNWAPCQNCGLPFDAHLGLDRFCGTANAKGEGA